MSRKPTILIEYYDLLQLKTMASPIKRIMSLRESRNSTVSPHSSPSTSASQANRKPKFLKILRRQSFNGRRKSNDSNNEQERNETDAPAKPAKTSSQTRDLETFEQYYKELRSAVQYFILVVDKFKSNMEIVMAKIPDNTSIVLESVINIDNMLDTCLRLHSNNTDLIPHRKLVHERIAELVRWTDQLLVRGNVKGNLEEGVDFVKALDQSMKEFVDLVIPRLRKREVNDEIRNSIFMFEGSSESIQVGEDVNSESSNGQWSSNKRDSGISEGSLSGMDSSSNRPSPTTSRDSGRGSINYIIDSDSHHHNGYLSPPEPPVRGRHSYRRTASYQNQINRAKDSDWSLSQASDSSSYRSLPQSPVSFNDEFTGHAYLSASSSTGEEGSFFSADEGDHMTPFEEPDSPIIQASFLGYIENHEISTPKRKAFQVYIELVGNYTQPSDGILKRPSSAYEGYQETFRRSITQNNSPNHHTPTGLKKDIFIFRNVADTERSHSLPILQSPTKVPSNFTQDLNRNIQTEMTRKKLLPLEEERKRKQSNTSSSSSSLSGTEDEDHNTPALDCLDVSRFLVYRDDDDGPTLIGGAIDALIVHASGSTKRDLVYYEAFLTTYRTFISAKDLINKLLYRERRFREKGCKKASQNAFFLLLRVVDELTGKVERTILEQLMKEIFRLLVNGHIVLGKILREKMLPKCEHYYRSRSPSSIIHPVIPDPSQNYSVLDFHAEELAKQLTLMDAKNFHNIEIPEILSWGKEQKEEHSPNLCIFTEHFNKVSYWCRTHVLSFEKPRDREMAYLKFLKIMKHLRRFNDFNSFFGILSALDCSAVRRLNWPKHLTDGLAEYATLIDSTSSFRAYREALALAEPPCIPYLGLILQDVTFVYHGNADELPDGKVNFVKRWQLFNIMDNVRRFKLNSYDFEWNDQIAQLFARMDNFLSEEDLYDRSLRLKPRE